MRCDLALLLRRFYPKCGQGCRCDDDLRRHLLWAIGVWAVFLGAVPVRTSIFSVGTGLIGTGIGKTAIAVAVCRSGPYRLVVIILLPVPHWCVWEGLMSVLLVLIMRWQIAKLSGIL